MRTLVYLRTHSGDPAEEGIFGVNDCMGGVRSWGFEAVIGVGGMGTEAQSWGNSGKVTWIGLGPRQHDGPYDAPLVSFDHFAYFGEDGRDFQAEAPALARRMYRPGHHVRTLMDDLSPQERAEVAKLLLLAKDAPPSPARDRSAVDEDGPEAQRTPGSTRSDSSDETEEVETPPQRKCRPARLPR